MGDTVTWVECNTEQWIDFLDGLKEGGLKYYSTEPAPHLMEFRAYDRTPLVRLDYSYEPRKAYYNQEVADHAQGKNAAGTGE